MVIWMPFPIGWQVISGSWRAWVAVLAMSIFWRVWIISWRVVSVSWKWLALFGAMVAVRVVLVGVSGFLARLLKL